jgi:hypothetical protein
VRQVLEPKRLADLDAPGALGNAIRTCRARTASSAEAELLARRLEAQLAAPTAIGVGRAVFGLGAKSTASLLLVCAVGLYAVLQLQSRTNAPVPHSAAAPIAPPTATASPVVAAAPAITPAMPVPLDAKPAIKHVRREQSHPEPHAPSVSPEAELRLLQPAQDRLEREPSVALALAEQHARLYPHGLFAQEREILAIEALLKLRQRPAAVSRAQAFVERYPDSAHARRVRALLERSQPTNDPPNAAASDHSVTDVPR